MDSEETWTRKREAHLVDTGAMRISQGCIWRVQETLMEDTTARSAPGGYRGQAGLTDTEDTAGVEHHLVKLGRYSGCGGELWAPSRETGMI